MSSVLSTEERIDAFIDEIKASSGSSNNFCILQLTAAKQSANRSEWQAVIICFARCAEHMFALALDRNFIRGSRFDWSNLRNLASIYNNCINNGVLTANSYAEVAITNFSNERNKAAHGIHPNPDVIKEVNVRRMLDNFSVFFRDISAKCW